MATSQASKNGASVSAFREKATCAIERAAKVAAAAPAPGPKVRRPSQPATGIVAIPREDRDHDRRVVGDAEQAVGKPDQERKARRGVRDDRRIEVEEPVLRHDPEAREGIDAFIEMGEAEAGRSSRSAGSPRPGSRP